MESDAPPVEPASKAGSSGALARFGTALRHRFGYGTRPAFITKFCERSALRLMHRAAAQALFETPKLRTVHPSRTLFVAPHMDDEAIGAGGAAELLRREDAEMSLVFTTDCAGTGPDPDRNAEIAVERGAEAENAAARMGMEYHGHLRLPTGSLSRYEPACGARLAELIARWKPETIFVPFPSDGHRDHQATSASLAIALKQSHWKGEIWCYEVWSPMFPNAVVDITDAVEEKRAFIECYPTQLEDLNYVEGGLGLNRLRGESVGVEFAEAYYLTGARGYIDLVRTLIS